MASKTSFGVCSTEIVVVKFGSFIPVLPFVSTSRHATFASRSGTKAAMDGTRDPGRYPLRLFPVHRTCPAPRTRSKHSVCRSCGSYLCRWGPGRRHAPRVAMPLQQPSRQQRQPVEHTALTPGSALVQQRNVLAVTWASSCYGLGQKVAANLPFGADHALTGNRPAILKRFGFEEGRGFVTIKSLA